MQREFEVGEYIKLPNPCRSSIFVSDRIRSDTMPGFGVNCIELKDYSATELVGYHGTIN
jgi:hypothetical protein